MHSGILPLRDYLLSLNSGNVSDGGTLANHLAAAWPHLTGSSNGGMQADKVYRLESPQWKPPVLTFQIERHAGTINGSTRAEMQHWEINVETGAAEHVHSTRRQLTPTAKRWDPKPLAKVLAQAIRQGKDHEKLRWLKDGTVVVRSDAAPGAYKWTVQGRRKRLDLAMDKELGTGWRGKQWRPPA